MMDALRVFVLADLLAAFALVGLVAAVGRRGGKKLPLAPVIGALLFLGICSALIYGGIWMILRVQ
jgi:hypothetical protein